jgi:hypothetical protein
MTAPTKGDAKPELVIKLKRIGIPELPSEADSELIQLTEDAEQED